MDPCADRVMDRGLWVSERLRNKSPFTTMNHRKPSGTMQMLAPFSLNPQSSSSVFAPLPNLPITPLFPWPLTTKCQHRSSHCFPGYVSFFNSLVMKCHEPIALTLTNSGANVRNWGGFVLAHFGNDLDGKYSGPERETKRNTVAVFHLNRSPNKRTHPC